MHWKTSDFFFTHFSKSLRYEGSTQIGSLKIVRSGISYFPVQIKGNKVKNFPISIVVATCGNKKKKNITPKNFSNLMRTELIANKFSQNFRQNSSI